MDRARDVGLIEAAFRIANERTARWEERHADGRTELYLCECAEQPCRKRIELTREQYEEVRTDPRHFVVLPGHVIADLETVVGSFDGYEMIEKPSALLQLLVETDPRSATSGPEADAARALAHEIDPNLA
ncbi:hypothetical protein OM076_43820 [Solirubrobacter ginsenosidimutans]|uniref:Uncharacterized protein n=1 Tax=Solirubrobacter ginsenosidimutans TaxID=490573 RepID=A0A9X3N2F0_9ACTN|nr:hypothetical protein [Solirubrobacter ginsenosidimutans]MDA0167269.1 hypothetical protein [Solirubrobacter ginsenosidimutans]